MKFVALLLNIFLGYRILSVRTSPTLTSLSFTLSTSKNETTKREVRCENGLCRILTGTADKLRGGSDLEAKIDELKKLGWSRDDSIKALNETSDDVIAAAEYLDNQQELREESQQLSNQLTSLGWNEEISKIAIKENNGNFSAALVMLENEERSMLANFENSVQDMITNGWDEIVARQALLAQWHLDKARFNGENTTVPREVLESIRPTLKKINDTKTPNTEKRKPPSLKGTANSPSQKAGVKPAKKEDVVFEVSINDFQKVVLDSEVPVLVDIYADWCGPCKQLGPLLEDAAIRAGGLFRLAKVNSDKERGLVESLKVSGLPTVYAVVKGKLTDRFVGMLQPNQIQDFLVRAVTGYGERKQSHDLTDQDLEDMCFHVRNLAGLASISFSKREKLFSLVDDCLAEEEVIVANSQEQFSVHEGVQTALVYIDNCRKDILNPKFRSISTSSKAFAQKVGNCASGKRLLEVAGFRLNLISERLEMVHNNSAILSLILQRAEKVITDRKLSYQKNKVKKIGELSPRFLEREPFNEQKKSIQSVPLGERKDTTEVTVYARGLEDRLIQKGFPSLKVLHETILELSGAENFSSLLQAYEVEIRTKTNKKLLTDDCIEIDMTLRSIAGQEEAISLVFHRKSNLSKKEQHLESSKNHKARGKRGGKVNNLFSSGILSNKSNKKNNEYFGGDSTVVQSGEEEEDDEQSSN